jgi:hypothetical protein
MMPGICQLRLDFNTLQLSVGDSDPVRVRLERRLNMELYLQSLLYLGSCVYSCIHWLRPRCCPPSPRIWVHIRGRYWSAKIEEIFCNPLICTVWLSYRLLTVAKFNSTAYL